RSRSAALPTSTLISAHAHACANGIAVAVNVIDTPYVRPELVLMQPLCRECGLLARIRFGPVVRGDHVGGVGRTFEQIVLLVGCARFDGLDFTMNADKRIAEAIQFVF